MLDRRASLDQDGARMSSHRLERVRLVQDEVEAELNGGFEAEPGPGPRLTPAGARATLAQLARGDDRQAAIGVLLLARLAASEWGEGVVLELAPTDEGTLATLEFQPAGWWAGVELRVRRPMFLQVMGDLFELLSLFVVSREGHSLRLVSRPLPPMRPPALTPLELPSLQLLIEAGLHRS